MRIMLACCAGMSTSLLVQAMQEACEASGKDHKIWAVEQTAISNELGKFDVLLLGPQVAFIKGKVRKIVGNQIPVEVIPAMDYGRCNGKNVVEFAEKLVKEKESK